MFNQFCYMFNMFCYMFNLFCYMFNLFCYEGYMWRIFTPSHIMKELHMESMHNLERLNIYLSSEGR